MSDPDLEPFRRFYAEGGYTGALSAKKRLDMALWGSQNYAEGGSVPPDQMGQMSPFELAYGSQFFNEGGPVLGEAVSALLKALGQIRGSG